MHQVLAAAGDTFWVQQVNAPVPAAGTVVTIADSAPTTDRWNFAAVEINPAGPPSSPVIVPDVATMTQSAASTKIIGSGLTVGTVTTASSQTAPAGTVMSETPRAGTQAPSGSVDLVVSSGPPPPIPVPNVVTLTQTAAQNAVVTAGSPSEPSAPPRDDHREWHRDEPGS